MMDMTVRDFRNFLDWLETAEIGETIRLPTRLDGTYYLKLIGHKEPEEGE